MQTSSIYASGHSRKPKSAKNKSTAYYLFDKSDACNLYSFKVEATHFRAANNTLNLPIVTDGSGQDMDRLTSEMLVSRSTPAEIRDHYLDGAKIQFHKPEVPAKIYKLIVDHFKAHLHAMKTDVTYSPPPIENFQKWNEFALAIRPMALRKDKYLESGPKETHMGYLFRRPSFSGPDEVESLQAPQYVIPQSTKVVDSIAAFLGVLDGR